jgi:hypothetical protein
MEIVLVPAVAVPLHFVMLLPMLMRQGVALHARWMVEAAVVGGQVLAVESVTTELPLFVVLRSHLD